MNRREFVKSGLFAAVSASCPNVLARPSAEPGLSETERTLLAETLARYDAANPLDCNTGKRKFIAFGALSDLHACKRIPGDDDPRSPKKDFWYYHGAVLTECEPSIRLLGAIAREAGLDAILHAGDFSTANTLKPLAPGEYRAVIRSVKAATDRAAPGIPFFTVDGNHDRDYWSAKTRIGNRMDNAEWAEVLKETNTDVSGSTDIVLTRHGNSSNPPLNSYTLDFTRLVGTGGPNVRLAVVSLYDKGAGSEPAARVAEGLRFDEAKHGLSPANTVAGFLSHDMMPSIAPTVRAYLDKNAHARVFGAIAGHRHHSYMVPLGAGKLSLKSKMHGVTNCFCEHGTTSREACRLSLFVVDTDSNRFHEIRLSGGDKAGPNHPKTSVSEFDCTSA